jgi:sn-glycerol 3-phosphate transport system permease protein
MVNALINSVKLIDHLFILTKGGPNDASKLVLYYIWEMAFAFFDAPHASSSNHTCFGGVGHCGRNKVHDFG